MSEVGEILEQQLRLLSVDEYIALADTGAFDGEKVELLRGRVVRVAPMGELHAWTMGAMTNLLVDHFGKWASVRPGAPPHASEDSMQSSKRRSTPKAARQSTGSLICKT